MEPDYLQSSPMSALRPWKGWGVKHPIKAGNSGFFVKDTKHNYWQCQQINHFDYLGICLKIILLLCYFDLECIYIQSKWTTTLWWPQSLHSTFYCGHTENPREHIVFPRIMQTTISCVTSPRKHGVHVGLVSAATSCVLITLVCLSDHESCSPSLHNLHLVCCGLETGCGI